MVGAAVHATVGPDRIRSVLGMGLAERAAEPTLAETTALVADAVGQLPEAPAGVVVAERGEFYEEPAWAVDGRLGVEPEFKYVETIGERETVQAAHHAAYAARELLV